MKSILTSVAVSCQRTVLGAIMASTILTGTMSGAELTVGVGPWFWENPLPQGDTLNGVSCPSTDVCYAVGNLGTILKGSNTWTTWTGQQSHTTQTLRAISCPDALTCFAVGDGGIILETLDGATWQGQSSPTTANLTGISCANRAACVAVGSGAAVTYQPFIGWQKSSPPAGISLNSVSCPATTAFAITCFAAGWTTVPFAAIAVTPDNGHSWNLIFLGRDPSFRTTSLLRSISCASTSFCVAVGQSWVYPRGGSVIHGSEGLVTSDGGKTWGQTLGQYPADPLSGVSCNQDALGNPLCYAVNQASPSFVFDTTNRGASWSTQFGQGNFPLNGISCQSNGRVIGFATICLAVGDHGAIVTNAPSAGPWINQTSDPAGNPTINRLTGSSCPTPSNCYAVGGGGTIVATSNGGATWTGQTVTSQNLSDISCPDTSTCFAVGPNSTIFQLKNGAWSQDFALPAADWNGVSCVSADICYFAGAQGSSGIIVESVSQQGNFASSPPHPVTGISCTAKDACVAVDASGDILTPASLGGWTVDNVTSNNLLAVSCASGRSQCVAVGAKGIIAQSNDSGKTWTTQTFSTRPTLTGVSCFPTPRSTISLPGTTCVATTLQGSLLETYDVGVTSWGTQGQIDSALNGVSCAFTSTGSGECVAVGDAGAILGRSL
jgi:photosystem II stability/assembly factor-like uncharacterized protein